MRLVVWRVKNTLCTSGTSVPSVNIFHVDEHIEFAASEGIQFPLISIFISLVALSSCGRSTFNVSINSASLDASLIQKLPNLLTLIPALSENNSLPVFRLVIAVSLGNASISISIFCQVRDNRFR